MMKLNQIENYSLKSHPYRWGAIDGLFAPDDAKALAETYPRDHFKTIKSYGGEKDYEYEGRCLIGMRADTASNPAELSEAWLALAKDLLSPSYRAAMSRLTGYDLTNAPMEVNVFHYGPGANLGPHLDLSDKVVTHVLYFNKSWNRENGGCLAILNSSKPDDLHDEIKPIVGNSAVLVRSESSWHAVSRVVSDCHESRRSVTVTFYKDDSQSSMWPPGDPTPLHRHDWSEPVPTSAEANGAAGKSAEASGLKGMLRGLWSMGRNR